MNIFSLDKNIKENIACYVDKHVVKMPLEYAQLLCSTHHLLNIENEHLYKPTHIHHPATKWTMQSIEHYMHVFYLFEAVSNEYTFRFNKTHASWLKLNQLLKIPPNNLMHTNDEIIPPNITPYKTFHVIDAYRSYYNNEKRHLFSWTKRSIPNWVKS